MAEVESLPPRWYRGQWGDDNQGGTGATATVITLVLALALLFGLAGKDVWSACAWAGLLTLGAAALVRHFLRAYPRVCYRLDADGLTRRSAGCDELFGWASIREVWFEDDGVVVETDRERLRLGFELPARRALGGAIRSHLSRLRTPEDRVVPAELVESWLGVGPGETLRTRGTHVGWWRAAWPLLFTLGMYVPDLLRGELLKAYPRFLLVLVAASLAGQTWCARRIVGAGRAGLLVRSRLSNHWLPWAKVLDLTTLPGGGWLVATAQGGLELSRRRPESAPIAACIRHLLDARDEGYRLPRMSAVPDNGLSRAEGSVSVERGLSRER